MKIIYQDYFLIKEDILPRVEDLLSKIRTPEERLKIIEESFKPYLGTTTPTPAIPETPKGLNLFPQGKSAELFPPTLEYPTTPVTTVNFPSPAQTISSSDYLTSGQSRLLATSLGGGTSIPTTPAVERAVFRIFRHELQLQVLLHL